MDEATDFVDRMTAEASEGCCGDESWRGRLCQYHQGFQAGADAMLEALHG